MTSRMAGWMLAMGLGVTLTTPALAQKKPKPERNRISREELVEVSERFSDLYQAIKSLRPHFLASNNRGVRTTGVGPSTTGTSLGAGGSMSAGAQPVVYIDGRKSGDPDVLKGFLPKDAEEVRYLSANEAGMEYGLGHEGGAIVVKLLTGGRSP